MRIHHLTSHRSRHGECNGERNGCSHNRHDQKRDGDYSNGQVNQGTQQSAWTPGTNIRGHPEPELLPTYRDERALGYKGNESRNEKDVWVGANEKS